MGYINQTRLRKNSQKKGLSLSSGTLVPTEDGTIASGDIVTLVNLPAHSVVTNAYLVVSTAPTGGTQTLKISIDGVDTIAATALGNISKVIKGGVVTKVYTGTGAAVTVTGGVAPLVDGIIEVVVEYAELDKVTGELTNF